jgi:hypothetical protein
MAPAPVHAQTGDRESLLRFGTPSGQEGGQLSAATGVAVNRSGAGGGAAGEVYVANANNRRVEVFSASGSFVRAFGYDVVASGEHNTGANEQQTVTLAPTITGGSYILRYNGTLAAARSAPIPYNATPAQVEAALDGIQNLGVGNVSVTSANPGGGSAVGGPYTVTFGGALAGNDAVQMTSQTSGNGAGLSGSPATVTVDTTRPGGGIEVCHAASSPPDACKAGPTGALAGVIDGLGGIAIDHATGNVFLPEATNRRVSVYSPGGVFQGAFGMDVIPANGAPAFEFCTTATGCQAGTSSALAGGFVSLTQAGIAVDSDSDSGDVYVADRGNSRVNHFSVELDGDGAVTAVSFVRAFGWDVVASGEHETPGDQLEVCHAVSTSDPDDTCKAGVAGSGDGQFPTNTPTSLAVDEGGNVYVASGTRLQLFNADATFDEAFGPSSGDCPTNGATVSGVAIDPSNQHVLVTQKPSTTSYRLCEFQPDGTLVDASPTTAIATTATASPQIAQNGVRMYVHTPTGGQPTEIHLIGPTPPPPGVAIAPVSGVSSTTAVFHGTVTVPASPVVPHTTYRFEYSTNGVVWHRAPSTNASVGDGSPGAFDVSQTVTGLSPKTLYAVRLVASTTSSATTSTLTFTTPGAAPDVGHVVAVPQRDRVALNAMIDPNSQATSYRVEWGSTAAYGKFTPATFRAVGSADGNVDVQELLEGLAPGQTYHYRFVAKNASGITTGPDHVVTTDGGPGDRAAELVSPPDNEGVGGTRSYIGTETEYQLAPDGNSIFYPWAYGPPDATSDGMLRHVATRHADGWRSKQATPTVEHRSHGNLGTVTEVTGRHPFLADDLSCAVVWSTQPHTPDTPRAPIENSGANLFTRDAAGEHKVLTTLTPSNVSDPVAVSQNSAGVYQQYLQIGASQDCRHAVFRTVYRYPGLNSGGIYRSDNGVMSDVAVRPDGSAAPDAVLGAFTGQGDTYVERGAVSEDGSRVFFTAISNGGNAPGTGDDTGSRALFMREEDTTVKVSASKTTTATRDAFFQVASSDGVKVAFLANYGLTPASSSGPTATDCRATPPRPCGLYVYDVETEELTDISATSDPANAGGATVAGVLDASEDLGRIYFAAQGQLVAGEGRSYAENVDGQTYNVYLYDHGTLAFVELITSQDVAQVTVRQGLAVSSQATPDGSHLLFSSRANIIGDDAGTVPEAYLYSAEEGTTTCLSCRRDGLPSVDDQPTPLRTNYNNALQAGRVLSDDGRRAFFTTMDALTPDAVDGRTNIYVWDQGAVRLVTTGLPPSFGLIEYVEPVLVGASASGNDVFVTTPESIDPRDNDGLHDLYDFRVGGGFPLPPTGQECDPLAGACQGGGSEGLAPPAVGTRAGTGEDELRPPRKRIAMKGLSKAQRLALSAGRVVRFAVRVNAAGRVRVLGTARIGGFRVSVLSARTNAKAPGWVRVPVRLSASARRTLVSERRLKLALSARLAGAHEHASRSVTLHAPRRAQRARTRSAGTTGGA